MKLRYFPLVIVIIWLFYQMAEAQSYQQAPQDIDFKLSLAGGKTIFRSGEPIKLLLTFTSSVPGYILDKISSPKLDQVIVSPTNGVYDWKYRATRLYSYDDVIERAGITTVQPQTIEIMLNDLVRFDQPGKYQVKIITKRVLVPQKDSYPKPAPLLSNTVDFEIKEMTAEDERAEIERQTAGINSAKNFREQFPFARDLSYLAGDPSTREKVNILLEPQKYKFSNFFASTTAFGIARNKRLAIELLEAALRDPNRAVENNLTGTLIGLRIAEEEERQKIPEPDFAKFQAERQKRSAEIKAEYFKELFDNLSQRTGKSQLITAYTIFTSLPKDDVSSPEFIATKNLLLAEFDELSPFGQSTLLNQFWDKIKTPALIPLLEKILSNRTPIQFLDRSVLLKRLIELDQSRARPFVIAEISDYNSGVNVDVLSTLDDKFLPETDAALLENIRQAAPLKTKNRDYQVLYTKSLLAARYATPKIYQDLLEIYRTYEKGWLEDSRDALIGYFVKVNGKEGIALIEERIKALGAEADSNIFYDITKMNFPRGLEKFLRKRLEVDNPSAVSNAAYLLSKYGGKENRPLIEKRYARWLADWSSRRAGLEDEGSPPQIRLQGMVQINIIDSLIEAKAWKLSDAEIQQLKLTCITTHCRQFFSIRYLPQNN